MKHKTLLTLIVGSVLVLVLASCSTPQPTPTSTAVPPTATGTPLPTQTPLPTATNTLVPMPTKAPTATPRVGTLYCPDCEDGVIKITNENLKVIARAHHGDAVEVMKLWEASGEEDFYRVRLVETRQLGYVNKEYVKFP